MKSFQINMRSMSVKKQLTIATLGLMLSAPVAFAEEQGNGHEAHHPEVQETTESGSETAGGEMPGGQSGMMGMGRNDAQWTTRHDDEAGGGQGPMSSEPEGKSK
jgi:hypothetical protein